MTVLEAARGNTAAVVVVGAGQAGAAVALALREQGHAGRIRMIGEELIAPYQRPPLSKGYLKGEVTIDALKLRSDDFYAGAGIDLQLGARAVSLATDARQLTLADGTVLTYESLVLATGARPRRLSAPGSALPGILQLRSIADADAIRSVLAPGSRIVMIGGGYIGLELAAAARSAGANVVVVEREARLLPRVASAVLADFLQVFHRRQGVEILTGAQVRGFSAGATGCVARVELGDGRALPCDAVVVGIGAIACDELARDAGLACDNGIVVDVRTRTSDPRVYAIGDVSVRPLHLYERARVRLESVPNALDQARQCAAAILGKARLPEEVPWFWSDQFDLKLQIAGMAFASDDTVVRGSVAQERFAVFHLCGGRVACVEAVNSPVDFMLGRRLIGSRAPVSRAQLGDPSVSLRQLAS